MHWTHVPIPLLVPWWLTTHAVTMVFCNSSILSKPQLARKGLRKDSNYQKVGKTSNILTNLDTDHMGAWGKAFLPILIFVLTCLTKSHACQCHPASTDAGPPNWEKRNTIKCITTITTAWKEEAVINPVICLGIHVQALYYHSLHSFNATQSKNNNIHSMFYT